MPGQPCYVEVAVFAPLPGTFTYQWPCTLGEPEKGIRVVVPFGKGTRWGMVADMAPAPADDAKIKAVLDRLDAKPLYDEVRSRWLSRLARYYLAGVGEAWELALAWAAHEEKRRFKPAVDTFTGDDAGPLSQLFTTRRAVSLHTLRQRADVPAFHHHIRQWQQTGQIAEDIPPLPKHEAGPTPAVTLTDVQQQAAAAIIEAEGSFKPFLLFGRTGSGKTEVYLQAAESVIGQGGQVLILVPEIGLTPMWLNRVASRFPNVGVWHSGLGERERQAVRHRLGELDVVIGTRSALFLPLPRLAMIVIDEEHDGAFKQQDGIAYSARDAALLLAQELSIPVVLGSATPSLESWRMAGDGHYSLLSLPDRIAAHAMQAAEVVDMRGVEAPVSEALKAALQQTLDSGQQSILFLNRRGYAPALQCTACGDVPECPACTLRLTLHRRARRLRCHACGFSEPAPEICPHCGEMAYLPLGEGTEKIEEWLAHELPALRFARFDRDVMSSHNRLVETLDAFTHGRLDCLIGTQMLVKGHHFPNVTLVGVVNADLGVNLPDFRAGERWWQQMTQVTGRAGRGDHPGRVVIQTRSPEAPWLFRLGEDQAEATLNEELELRRMLSFPPYARWVRIVFSSTTFDRAMQAAQELARGCQALPADIHVSGPMSCSMERLAGRFRVELLLRDPSRKLLPWQLAPLLRAQRLPSGVRRRVDVDPQDMM
jgi:primosomal protein N' (replication factor Y)